MKSEKARNQSNLNNNTDQPQQNDFENQLFEMGIPIGEKILELMAYREKGNASACNSAKREIKIVNMLHFINNQIWKCMFGRTADGLE